MYIEQIINSIAKLPNLIKEILQHSLVDALMALSQGDFSEGFPLRRGRRKFGGNIAEARKRRALCLIRFLTGNSINGPFDALPHDGMTAETAAPLRHAIR
jgi:hypothetical protein